MLSLACGAPAANPFAELLLAPEISGDTLPHAARPAVWDAILRYYQAPRSATEGDFVRWVKRCSGCKPDTVTAKAPIVLLTDRRGHAEPYDLTWLTRALDAGLLAGTCAARQPTACGDSVVTTYLRLDDPIRTAGDTVVVVVTETGLNPAECKEQDVFVGTWERHAILVNEDDDFVIVTLESQAHYTSTCSLIEGRT